MEAKVSQKRWERTAGIAGSTFIALEVVIKTVDWIGRGQTVLTLNPLIHFLATPIGVALALVCGFALVVLATRLEQVREEVEAPRIIVDLSRRRPEPVKRHWFWLKLAGSLVITSLILIAFSAWVQYRRRALQTQNASSSPITPAGPHSPTTSPPETNNPSPSNKAGITPNATPRAPLVVTADHNLSMPRAASSVPVGRLASPTTPPRQSPLVPAQPAPTPGPDSPVVCPKEGTLVGSWTINNQMMQGNIYTFSYAFSPEVINSLNPFLRQVISPGNTRITPSQLIKLISVSEEIEDLIPKPNPVHIDKMSLVPEVTIQSIVRSLSDPDVLQVTYMTKLPNITTNFSDRITVSKIPIAAISETGRKSISEFDSLADTRADISCKQAVSQLFKQP